MPKKEKQPHGGSLNRYEKGEPIPAKNKKKSFALLNEQLKAEGYEPLTKTALNIAYSLLFSLDQEKIEELAEDKTQPLAIRLIIQEMTNENTSGKAIQDMRNYLFGTAVVTEKHEVKHKFGADLDEDNEEEYI